jgi:hypothetical protein
MSEPIKAIKKNNPFQKLFTAVRSLVSNKPIKKPSTFPELIIEAFISVIFFCVIGIIITNNESPMYGFLQSTDDIVRMVMVRDWMNGQSWYDPMLYKLGYHGTVMHWSRLVDAPIAFFIIIGNLFVPGKGEQFAAYVWPTIIFFIAYLGILVGVRRVVGFVNSATSIIIGGTALFCWGEFVPGVIDHHNVQMALTIWLIVSLFPAKNDHFNLMFAGVASSLSVAVGAETLPMVVAGAMAVFLRLLAEREDFFKSARFYGLGLSASISILFVSLIGSQNYEAVYCDSLSLFQYVSAGLGGFLLYVGLHQNICKFFPKPYVSIPVLSGIFVFGTAYLFFPHCLSDPSAIDPLLQRYWLNYISEAQSISQIFNGDTPSELISEYMLAIIASVVLVYKIIKKIEPVTCAILLIYLIIAIAVTMLQIRGVKLLIPIAALTLLIPMTRFMDDERKEKTPFALIYLLACCNITWFVVTALFIKNIDNSPKINVVNNSNTENKNTPACHTNKNVGILNSEKLGFIAAPSGHGPWLLFNTNHRVLAGPYHRNVEPNKDIIKILIGTEQEAKALLKNRGITHFMSCPTFADDMRFVENSPNGFLAQLLKGKTPDWLEPLESTMKNDLKIWRVKPNGALLTPPSQ